MNPTDMLLLAFDRTCSDPFESLAAACDGLTDEECRWRVPAYNDVPAEDVGLPGTILWQLNHLELCARHHRQVLELRDPDRSPQTEPVSLDRSAVLAALEAANDEMRATIAALDVDALATIVTPNRNAAEFVMMSCRHVVWHAAQIRMIRRMYEARDRSSA
jgi:uncharacterized damage-inducible protein DinB